MVACDGGPSGAWCLVRLADKAAVREETGWKQVPTRLAAVYIVPSTVRRLSRITLVPTVREDC